MNRQVRTLYWVHALNSIAISVVAGNLFVTNIMLRMELDKALYGLIWGVGMFVPSIVNLVLSPWLQRLDKDHLIAGGCNLTRVLLSFLFLLIPALGLSKSGATAALGGLVIVWMTFPYIANNGLASIIKRSVPADQLGRQTAVFWYLQTTPAAVTAIAAGWYIGRYADASDDVFYRALFWAGLVTGLFQLPATILLFRFPMPPRPASLKKPPSLRTLMEPLRDKDFVGVLLLLTVLNGLLGAVQMYQYPYAIEYLGWSMWSYQALDASLIVCGAGLLHVWGILADRHGGRSVLAVSLLGFGLSLPLLAFDQTWSVVSFAILGWMGVYGIFGAGVMIGSRHLTIGRSKAERSNVDLAVATCVSSLGAMIGSAGGGWLIDVLKARWTGYLSISYYGVFFLLCGLMAILMLPLMSFVREEKRTVGPAEMAMAVYRVARDMLTRSREG